MKAKAIGAISGGALFVALLAGVGYSSGEPKAGGIVDSVPMTTQQLTAFIHPVPVSIGQLLMAPRR